MIHKYNRIASLLAANDRPDLTFPERDEVNAALRREIETAWETDEVRDQRPTPLDEVRSGLIVFEQSVWQAMPAFLREVDRALVAATGRGLPLEATPVSFGSWIGGDRDGNPSVTPEVTVKDRKSTRLNSSHSQISYAVFCLKKKNTAEGEERLTVP